MTDTDIIEFINRGYSLQFRPIGQTWRVKLGRDIRFLPGQLCRKMAESRAIERRTSEGMWQNWVPVK